MFTPISLQPLCRRMQRDKVTECVWQSVLRTCMQWYGKFWEKSRHHAAFCHLHSLIIQVYLRSCRKAYDTTWGIWQGCCFPTWIGGWVCQELWWKSASRRTDEIESGESHSDWCADVRCLIKVSLGIYRTAIRHLSLWDEGRNGVKIVTQCCNVLINSVLLKMPRNSVVCAKIFLPWKQRLFFRVSCRIFCYYL